MKNWLETYKWRLLFSGMIAAVYFQKSKVHEDLNYVHSHLKTLGISLAVACLAFAVEAFAVGWSGCSLRRLLRPEATHRRDIIIYLLDLSTIWLLIGNIFSFGIPGRIGGFLSEHAAAISTFKVIPAIPSLIVQTILIVFSVEFVSYWIHRAFHEIPFLWELHKYHHSAEDFCILTARRDHPFMVPLFGILTVIPAALFGAPSSEVVWIFALISFHAMIIHSQTTSSWGFIGRWIFVSPHGHRIHHSLNPDYHGKNFGFLTPFWDRVFGSFTIKAPKGMKVGVSDGLYNHRPLWEEMVLACTQTWRVFMSYFGNKIPETSSEM